MAEILRLPAESRAAYHTQQQGWEISEVAFHILGGLVAEAARAAEEAKSGNDEKTSENLKMAKTYDACAKLMLNAFAHHGSKVYNLSATP